MSAPVPSTQAPWRAAFDALQTPVFLCDAQLQLTYVNPYGLTQLRAVSDVIRETFDVRVDDMVGSSIHRFHRDPRHVESVLRDPSKLPAQVDLRFGGLVLETRISALYDDEGDCLGYVASWEEVTSARRAVADLEANSVLQEHQAGELRIKASAILDAVEAATHGDLTRRVPVAGEDTIGQLGEAIQAFFDRLHEDVQRFATHASALKGSSGDLSTVSQDMSAEAEQTSTRAQQVAIAVDRVHESVQIVATGAEEMTASISEIAGSASQASRVAAKAVDLAGAASRTIGQLDTSSREIGEVLKFITRIAQQTNLLALNATIEAARAGEAGRGFAVVAGEVKELAKQTATATEDISARVEAIRGSSEAASRSIREISEIIGEVHDLQSTIAGAVEEQTATTREMSRSINDAATASSEISDHVAGVAESADRTSSSASAVERSSSELAELAQELDRSVGRYRLEAEPELMPWGPELAIGVSSMDGQHRVLVALLNQVNRLLQQDATEELAAVLGSLIDYTVIHFAAEERLMAEHAFPDLEEHSHKHEALIDQVAAYKQRFEAGEGIGPELLEFLVSWLRGHILGSDKEYARHLEARAAR